MVGCATPNVELDAITPVQLANSIEGSVCRIHGQGIDTTVRIPLRLDLTEVRALSNLSSELRSPRKRLRHGGILASFLQVLPEVPMPFRLVGGGFHHWPVTSLENKEPDLLLHRHDFELVASVNGMSWAVAQCATGNIAAGGKEAVLHRMVFLAVDAARALPREQKRNPSFEGLLFSALVVVSGRLYHPGARGPALDKGQL